MNISQTKEKSTRVKACTECRQQKLKCDASQKGYAEPCSRCHRHGIECIMSRSFRRVKRLTKSELQAEVQALRDQITSAQAGVAPNSSSVQNASPLSDVELVQTSPVQQDSQASTTSNNIGPNHANQAVSLGALSNHHPHASDILLRPLITPPVVELEATAPQCLQDLQVSAEEINDCFHIFHKEYSYHVPVVANDLQPNTCYEQSHLLFWTIVATGSRRYVKDPTLIIQLGPKVTELAKEAILTRENILFTIQALILLCTWPMPFDSLGSDVTPVLSGAMLQLSMIVGLHVYGVGQDFARTKLEADTVQRDRRTMLWAITLVVFQRGHILSGMPGLYVPDMYDHEDMQGYILSLLPPSIYFQRRLYKIYVDAILDIERRAMRKTAITRDVVLSPLLDEAFVSLTKLHEECPTDIDRLYLLGSMLQILNFRFYLPSTSIDEMNLRLMYDTACSLVDLTLNLDHTSKITDYGPMVVSKYLHLAACTILKIGRSEIRESIELAKGQKAYFSVIQLHKKLSVRSDDVFARSTIILTQLWTSKNVFRYPDGTFDPLSVRFTSRYGMSAVFDCYWWWRQEFAGQPNPYGNQTGSESNSRVYTESLAGSEAKSPLVQGWSTQIELPESQWVISDDMMMDDWTHLQAEADLQFRQIPQLTPGWI